MRGNLLINVIPEISTATVTLLEQVIHRALLSRVSAEATELPGGVGDVPLLPDVGVGRLHSPGLVMSVPVEELCCLHKVGRVPLASPCGSLSMQYIKYTI